MRSLSLLVAGSLKLSRSKVAGTLRKPRARVAFCMAFAGLCAGSVTVSGQTKSATTTTLTVTSGGTAVSSVTVGSVVTLTATVNSGGAAVTPGQVNFCDANATHCTDIHLLGTAQLTSAGMAQTKVRLGIGSHSIKAVFLGTNIYAGSASAASALTVIGTLGPIASASSVAETGSWGNYALTATVTEAGQTKALTGAASFLDANSGNAVLATATLGTSVAGIGWPNPKSINAGGTRYVLMADLNGDGIPDLAVNDNPLVIYLGNADGTYTEAAVPSISGPTTGPMVSADFNGDGIPDLAVAMYAANTVSILLGNGDGTFGTPVAVNLPSAGAETSQLVTADFNGDGIADLAVVDNSDSMLDILLGNGDGTFTSAASPSIAVHPSGVAVEDFNGDGKTDLAVADSYSDSIAILSGNGDGTFTTASTVHSGSQNSPIAAADFNGDGNPDLAVAAGGLSGTSESVTILTGNGDGTFNSPSSGQSSSSTSVAWIQVADFNQDGVPDLVVADSKGSATVFLNNGSRSFSGSTPVVTGLSVPYYLMVGVGDLNGDGYPDIAAGGYYNNTLGLFLTEPTETATASASISLPPGMHEVDASYSGDSNYDASVSTTIPLWGDPPATTTTLTVTSGGSPVTSVAAGTAVTLTATVNVGASPVSSGEVKFCDASATYCTDIHVLGTASLASSGTATFKFVPGPGTHSYKAVFVEDGFGLSSSSNSVSLTVGPAPSPVYSDTTAITLGGYAGNYSLTATVVGYGGTAPPTGSVSFLDTSFGNATLGTASLGPSTSGIGWPVSQTPALSYAPAGEVKGDFNGDGITDLALLWNASTYGGPYSVTVFFGTGNGKFTAGPTTAATGVQSYSTMVAADLNGDGKADLAIYGSAVTYDSTSVTVMLSNGDGTFAASQTTQAYDPGPVGGDGVAGSMVAADFNGDGKMDLAAVGGLVASGEVTILLGNGDGTFAASGVSYGDNSSFASIATGDFNGDGIPDLVVANFFSPDGATVLLGKGDGKFAALPAQISAATFINSIVVGDFNGDGKLDLGFASNGGVGVFLGSGDGTFEQAANSPAIGASKGIVVGDFNNDGKLDMAGSNDFNDELDVYMGVGDGTFQQPISTPNVTSPSIRSYGIVAGDFNGDGTSDLALLTANVNGASILLTEPTQTATATITGVAPVGAGTHNVEASYTGDSNYAPSVSGTTPLTAALTPVVISPNGGISSSVVAVTMNESIPGATIYYEANGPVQTSGFIPYTGPIVLSVGGVEYIQAYATETGYQQSNYSIANFTLSFPIAPAPVISPAGGSFAGPQSVTISDSVAGAAIHYTTDGTTPTLNSALYAGPITVSTSEALSAIAVPSGYTPSNSATAQFFIGSSQSSFIYTVAGNQSWGYAGDGGPATAASLNYPEATAMDSAGNLYIADTGNNVVRKVAAGSGTITTVAGNGTAGYSGNNGPATSAQLFSPYAVAVDGAGNLYIADTGNHVVRMVAATTGTITTVAGSTTATSLGDNGPATSAQLVYPDGLAFDKSGNLYISDWVRVREVAAATGTITTVAGNGGTGYTGDNGPATSATFSSAEGIAVDAAGNLYIADSRSNAIRKVTASTGIITTVAGGAPSSPGATFSGDGGLATSAQLYQPQGVVVDAAGNIYIADTNNYAVREVTASNGIINTIAGHPLSSQCTSLSGDGGPAADSAICYPTGVTLDSAGNLYIAEYSSDRIREVTVAAAPPTSATAAPVFSPSTGSFASAPIVGLTSATPGAEIYVTLDGTTPATTGEGYHGPIDVTSSVTLQAVAVAPGHLPSAPVSASYTITTPPAAVVTTVAGNGEYGMSGVGGLAINAELRNPDGVAFDAAGNLYIADPNNSAIWKVTTATGVISVAAGTPGIAGNSGDGGLATSAFLHYPTNIAFDGAGNMYIADTANNVVRKVSAQTGTISVYAGGSSNVAILGDGGPAASASLSWPEGLAFDSAGNLYISDSSNNRIRMVSASTGIINTVAGGGTGGALGDGGPATSATLRFPEDLALDSQGNLYIADEGNARVRVVNAATKMISTLAGNGIQGESGDGGPATNAEIEPYGIALDSPGNIYISNPLDEVRMVPAGGGVITTVAGSGYSGFAGDGGSARLAEFCLPEGLAFDNSGSLYIGDWCNYRVRKVTFSRAAATPTFSLAPGTYNSAQTITITEATQGATIYYTTDGSTPTTGSSVYSGPISLSQSTTLRAIAVASGYDPSAIASATYNILIAPTVAVAPSASSITTAQSLSVAVTVSGVSGQIAPTGSVTLSSGSYSAQQELAGGSATFNLAAGTLPVGSNTLTATYSPDLTSSPVYATATQSATVMITTPIGTAAASVSVSPSAQTITDAQPVNLAVTVSGNSGQPTPTGSITVSADSYSAQQTLLGGAASFIIPAGTLAAGSNTLGIVYSGDSTYSSGSGSAAVTVADVALSASSPAAVSPGGSSNTTVTLYAGSTYSGSLNLSCALTSSPAGAQSLPTCSLSPSSTTIASGGSITSTLTIHTTAGGTTASLQPFGNSIRWFGGEGAALAVILLFGIPTKRRRRWMSYFILTLLVSVGAAAIGCGGGGSQGAPPPPPPNPPTTAGTYSFTVTATDAANKTITASTIVTITVK